MKYKYLVGDICYNQLSKDEKEKAWELQRFLSYDSGRLISEEYVEIFLQRYKNIVTRLNRKYKNTSTWEVELFIPSEQALSHILKIKYSPSKIVGISIQLHLIKSGWKPF